VNRETSIVNRKPQAPAVCLLTPITHYPFPITGVRRHSSAFIGGEKEQGRRMKAEGRRFLMFYLRPSAFIGGSIF